MVTLRLWAKPCPEREGGPGDAHRGPGVATGGCCPSVLGSPSVAFQGRALSLVGFGLLSHQGTWDRANSRTPGYPGVIYNMKQWFVSLWFS